MPEPKWMDLDSAIEIHDAVIEQTGGSSGIRDKGLLESALSRPLMSHHYEDNHDIFDLAARYTESVAKNHAFVDGNKRTAFLLADIFLLRNGHDLPKERNNEQYELIDGIATGAVSREQLADYFRKSCTVQPAAALENSSGVTAQSGAQQREVKHANVANKLA